MKCVLELVLFFRYLAKEALQDAEHVLQVGHVLWGRAFAADMISCCRKLNMGSAALGQDICC
jgi:hypothetical protein